MSKFYREISKYYEDIFPKDDNQIKFLNEISDGKEYLDIGCATGLVAKNLVDLGKDVTCIDVEKSMVKEALKKGLKAEVRGMLDLDCNKKFDVCYCVGTTFAHLNNKKEVIEFLDKVPNILKDDGKLVLHWINFTPFVIKNDYFLGSLPTLGTNVKFERNYYREDDLIKFNTILTTDDEVFENTELMVPLVVEDIVNHMENNGYNIKLYGDFEKSEFDIEKSDAVVIVASR